MEKGFSFRTVHISYVYDFINLLGEIGEDIGVSCAATWKGVVADAAIAALRCVKKNFKKKTCVRIGSIIWQAVDNPQTKSLTD